jgi:hypothetical protein
MGGVLSYNNFFSVNEKGDAKKADAEKPAEKVDPVDTSGGTIKDIVLDGKTYVAVLSTFKAILEKQAAMGKDAVGMYSLPGSELVYELLKKEEKKDGK